jgi:hypothetical protein
MCTKLTRQPGGPYTGNTDPTKPATHLQRHHHHNRAAAVVPANPW